MPHEDYVTLTPDGGTGASLYLSGPIVPELAEVLAPKIVDIAEEDDRRVGPSVRTINSVADGIGLKFLDSGQGMWDARNVWTLEGNRITPRPALDGTNDLTCSWEFSTEPGGAPMLMTHDPDDSTEYLYVQAGDSLYKVTEIGGVATLIDGPLANIRSGRRLLEFKEKDAANHRLFAFWHRHSATIGNYRYSNHEDFDAWNDGGRQLSDAIQFRDFILAAEPWGKIVYSTTGLNGSWNDEDATNDGEPIVDMGGGLYGQVRFCGVANAPWGRPAPYYIHKGRLYALLYDAREYVEIPLQNSLPFVTGVIWQGLVAVHDYFNVFIYDPDTQKSKNVGHPVEQLGRPFSRQYKINHLFTAGEYLCAVTSRVTASLTDAYEVLFYDGRGWHAIYSDWDHSPIINRGFAGYSSAWRDVSTVYTEAPQVYVLGGDKLVDGTGLDDIYLQRWNLPHYGTGPVNNTYDSSYTSPSHAYAEYPWLRIYGDLDGVLVGILVHAYMPAATASTIRVYYRITEDAAWTQIGEMAVGEIPYEFMPFGTKDGDNLYGGVDFRQVQLKIAFYTAAAGNAIKFPELYSITPVFSKHTTRMRWRFVIDVAGTAANEDPGTLLQNYSDILKHLKNCIDNPLCKLEVPNITKSRGEIVQVLGQHTNFYRDDQVGGDHNVVSPGQIQVVFEEVAPRESDGFHTQQLPS